MLRVFIRSFFSSSSRIRIFAFKISTFSGILVVTSVASFKVKVVWFATIHLQFLLMIFFSCSIGIRPNASLFTHMFIVRSSFWRLDSESKTVIAMLSMRFPLKFISRRFLLWANNSFSMVVSWLLFKYKPLISSNGFRSFAERNFSPEYVTSKIVMFWNRLLWCFGTGCRLPTENKGNPVTERCEMI